MNIKQGPEVGKAKEFLLELEDDYIGKKKELTKEEAEKELLKKFKKTASIAEKLKQLSKMLEE